MGDDAAGASPVDAGVVRPVPERVTLVCVLEQQSYRPGDQAPEGYLEWHAWAEVQHKAGLRQKQCGRCGLWRFPQQLSALVDSTEVTGLRKRRPFRRTLEAPVCNDCADKADSKTPNVAIEPRR
jgi:hypothetical protein